MKVVCIEPLGVAMDQLKPLMENLEKLGCQVIQYDDRTTDLQVLIERGKEADVIMLANQPFSGEVMAGCPNLKMLSVAFTGVDHVDMDYCRTHDILVSNSAGYSTNAVAELTYGLIIGLYRKMVACDSMTREGGTNAGMAGLELAGKKLGVIGTGAIGEKVIEIGQAFGCDILAYSRTEKETLIEKGVRYMPLDTLMAESDIVSLHIPNNPHTKGLINAELIDKMKESSIFINTARGPIVDSEALARALKEGAIAGAGIDVYEMEPPIPTEHPLLNSPNTLVAPHVAFLTKEALVKRAVISYGNVESWIQGTPVNVMN